MAIESADVGNAHCTPAVAACLEDGFFFVFIVFVFDVADDLFQHVFHGDETRCAAVFINHDSQVVATATEVMQQDVKPLGFGNEHSRTNQRTNAYGRVGDGQQKIFGQKNADDIVAVVFVDRKPGTTGIDNVRQQCGQRLIDIKHVHT